MTAAAALVLLALSLSMDGTLGGLGTPAGLFWVVVVLGGACAAVVARKMG